MRTRRPAHFLACFIAAASMLLAFAAAASAGPGRENAPAAAPAGPPQTSAAPLSAEQGAPLEAGVPPIVNADQAPPDNEADAMISAGQTLAIQGAKTRDRLMIRAGRRMIRDGALLKRSQQLAK